MENQKSNFEKGINIISALRIVASPTILGIIIGFIIYKILDESNRGSLLFGITSIIGLIIGIFWATKISKEMPSSDFISKVNASPDIDEAIKDKK